MQNDVPFSWSPHRVTSAYFSCALKLASGVKLAWRLLAGAGLQTTLFALLLSRGAARVLSRNYPSERAASSLKREMEVKSGEGGKKGIRIALPAAQASISVRLLFCKGMPEVVNKAPSE